MAALQVVQLHHRYGTHVALQGLNLTVEPGQIFALLGPNGSGKTTLFKLLSTLMPVRQGSITVFGHALPGDADGVRRLLGVVFQNPSCDRKLTVRENLRCQSSLYGLSGRLREERIAEVIEELGLSDRLDWRMDKLSGGQQRRVDVAKSMLHAPRLLILDEPSTGLDPAARLDLWHALVRLRDKYGVTVVMTTHLLEEAEKAEQIGIMHQGQLVAEGAPQTLRSQLGARVLVIEAKDADAVAQWLATRRVETQREHNQFRISGDQAVDLLKPMTDELGSSVRSLSLGEPSLEDVFIARTGHRFWDSVDNRSPKK